MERKSIIFCSLLFLAALVISCGKDSDDDDNIPVEPDASVYVRVKGDKTKYRDLYSLNDTTLAVGIVYKNDMTYVKDVAVTLNTDLSLVNAYNTENGTSYKPLPTNAFSLETSVSIPAGKSSSDFNISVKSSVLEIGDAYLLPVTLKSVATANTDVVIEKAYQTFYLVVFTDLIPEPPDDDWEADLAKNTWTIAGFSTQWQPSDSPTAYLASKVLDGDLSTYWHSEATDVSTRGLPQWFIIDMHGKKRINGFTIANRQGNAESTPRNLKIEVSKDNAKWITALDVPALPQVRTLQTLPLENPLVCRYIKVTVVTSWATAPYTYIAEFSAY